SGIGGAPCVKETRTFLSGEDTEVREIAGRVVYLISLGSIKEHRKVEVFIRGIHSQRVNEIRMRRADYCPVGIVYHPVSADIGRFTPTAPRAAVRWRSRDTRVALINTRDAVSAERAEWLPGLEDGRLHTA